MEDHFHVKKFICILLIVLVLVAIPAVALSGRTETDQARNYTTGTPWPEFLWQHHDR